MKPDPKKIRLLVLLGPTAVGKTKISIEIARRFQCEIISGDSMQVYKGMDIGTAKITKEEMQGIPHHMIDIYEPDQPFSVAEFQDRARTLIRDIHDRGKLPFLVGGTGLYIESLCYSYEFSEGGSDEAFREEQAQFAKQFGAEALHQRLRDVDPVSANRIHSNDIRRVIRALEIPHLTGQTLSEQIQGQKRQSPYELCIIGLTMERALLYKRIEQRVDQMLKEGLEAEVRRLLEQGFTKELVSMHGLGYKEIAGYLSGDFSREEAITLLKRDTRRFAKRQLSWFRHMKDIHWVDVSELENISEQMCRINGIITEIFALDQETVSENKNDIGGHNDEQIH